MTRLPHVRESSRSDPDVCVHCRLPWVDLFTDRPEDECPARLRAALDAPGPLRWERHPNNPHAWRLVVGRGPNEVTIGRMLAGHDRALGHAIMVSVGTWAETAKWSRERAAEYLCHHLGIDPPVVP